MPAEALERRGIYRAQMEKHGQARDVLDKIIEGKLGNFY